MLKQISPFLKSLIQQNQKIHISPLIKQKQYQEQALRMLCEQFSQKEPLSIECNVTSKDIRDTIEILFETSLKNSSIAYTPHNDTILSVQLSADVIEVEEDPAPVSLSLQPMINLVSLCSDIIYNKKQINPDNIKHGEQISLMMIALHPDASKMNVAVNTVLHNLQLAQQNKFQLAIMECTSKRSAAMGHKIDFEQIGELQYDKIKVDPDNKYHFKNLPIKHNEDKIYILTKELQNVNFNSYNFDPSNIFQFQYN